MKLNDKILEVISHETKDTIGMMDVVTPSIYASIFSKYANLHNTDISEEQNITNDLLDEKIAFFTNIQNQTSNNAKRLNDNTNRAIFAIKGKDEKILNEVLQETQELRQEINSLKELMYKDELTRAYNRKWMNDNILNEDAQELKDSGTLAIIDLNYFKIINDTYGHNIGDKVLVFIANQLKKTKETVVRYGGDEFIVMFCEGTTHKTALSKLNAIREDLLTKHIKVKDTSFKISFSFGVQEFKKGDSLNDTIEKADKYMYEDKKEIKKRISGI
ncbi:MAG: GGDEF domain-containing protein [Sulfurimonas sp.]|uniref:GGDEF domain-containing protein n=1 Tax=Sulfurimonas sp. TaxID=2022749 RepID=UPI00263A0B34|nr:GGDEF domain-containing protein [Sulfurimonas sp.]MCW8894850.1 GGDEF domain-containing protein [Sulfurimonas sp.]MCW8953950.1 GGDEF domain-containing protein [Sulfurimonas sp.]MCW9067689.1 GGDEF domain-containing protein [Sulfurimonas sp.]